MTTSTFHVPNFSGETTGGAEAANPGRRGGGAKSTPIFFKDKPNLLTWVGQYIMCGFTEEKNNDKQKSRQQGHDTI